MSKLCEWCEEEVAHDGPVCSDCYIGMLDSWRPILAADCNAAYYSRGHHHDVLLTIRSERFLWVLSIVGAVTGLAALTLTAIGWGLMLRG